MTTFWGSDTDQLRGFGDRVGHEAAALDTLRERLTRTIEAVPWDGPDAEAFRQSWSGTVQATLSQCRERLEADANDVRSQATEQDSASESEGGTHGGGGDGWATGGGGQGSGYVGHHEDDDDHTPVDPKDRKGDPTIPKSMEDWDTSSKGYAPPAAMADLDDQTYSADHISQNGVNDCWFLASLGATANANPEFVRKQIHDNGDGTYTVTLYDHGEPVQITVNGTFNPAGAQSPQDDPNWASIYEKAGAEYMGGSYKDMDFDSPERGLEMITGKDAEHVDGVYMNVIRTKLEDGPVVLDTKQEEHGWWIFTSDGVQSDNIVPNHDYVVDKVEMRENPPGSGHREEMVQVQNPWGPNAKVNGHDGGKLWLTQQQLTENFAGTTFVDTPGRS